MTKKIICILVGMLFVATVPAITGATHNNAIASDISPNTGNINPNQNRAMWNLQFSFDVTTASGAAGNAGSEFDGTYFYSTRWAANLIHRYDTSGVKIEEFSIPGVTGLRDLAFDGTYMYGGAAAGTIYKMDFVTKTLVGTITGGFQCRAIAYDTDQNVIYCKNWGDPCYVVDPTTGAILNQFNFGTIVSTYGLAYDDLTPGGPYLWVFDQGGGAGTPQIIYQWDIAAGAFTGVTHDVTVDIPGTAGIAGGLFFTQDFVSGYTTLGGLLQGTPDMMFCYEIGQVSVNNPPNVPPAPSGPDNGVTNVQYTFTANTTDPEGDNISYMFDWGDGYMSDWIGPFNSGTAGTAVHQWAQAGTYEVKAKAKDVNGAVSGWSQAHSIVITEAPILKVLNITGGLFKVKSSIKNIGGVAASNINWTIELTGGAIIGKLTTGNILSLASGEERAITSKFIFGLGKTVIKVTAMNPQSTDEKSQAATVLLIFIKI